MIISTFHTFGDADGHEPGGEMTVTNETLVAIM
jgi:hypothetical protein